MIQVWVRNPTLLIKVKVDYFKSKRIHIPNLYLMAMHMLRKRKILVDWLCLGNVMVSGQ